MRLPTRSSGETVHIYPSFLWVQTELLEKSCSWPEFKNRKNKCDAALRLRRRKLLIYGGIAMPRNLSQISSEEKQRAIYNEIGEIHETLSQLHWTKEATED